MNLAKTRNRGVLLALACVLEMYLAGSALASPPQDRAANSSAPQAAVPFQYVGAGGCSAPACHGSVRPMTQTRIWQNEYSTWVTQDKHSNAYTVLSGPVAVRMARILGLPAANTAPKCLACHAIDVPASQRARTFDISDGVSCESCHGPASAWLGPHTTVGWTHAQSLKLGMYDTRNLVLRTERCLECHLGTKIKYVDHEMLAAGHPDLYFELDSFEATMPRHWKQPLDTDPWRDVREWATGQAVQLRAEMQYLGDSTQRKAWPDYAQLDCFACHHSLVKTENSWRQQRGYAGRRPGNPPWNASRYIVFREMARTVDPALAAQLDASLGKVEAQMSQLAPDRAQVAASAAQTVATLDDLAQRTAAMPYDQAMTLKLMRDISGDADGISGAGERSAEQAAMALNSLFLAYSRNVKMAGETDLRAAIGGLYQQLQNPSAYDAYQFSAQLHKVNALLR
ncbi:MAG TPA: multiheme c-type cytochrome [Candidatus Limnocylindrales bacterium]|nr:multiheme c-type cytochrome [Candidatus Limnocylindrales bacterium]